MKTFEEMKILASCGSFCHANQYASCVWQVLDLSKIRIPAAQACLRLNLVKPVPDEILAMLDVHPDDPRQEENSSRKPMFDRGLQLIAEARQKKFHGRFAG